MSNNWSKSKLPKLPEYFFDRRRNKEVGELYQKVSVAIDAVLTREPQAVRDILIAQMKVAAAMNTRRVVSQQRELGNTGFHQRAIKRIF